MSNRPLSVTVLSWFFMGAGVVGIIYHFKELNELTPEIIWVLTVRILAIIGGVFALRGANWARWLLLVWMIYHTGLSVFHPASELITHALLLMVVIYVFFRPKASVYFRGK